MVILVIKVLFKLKCAACATCVSRLGYGPGKIETRKELNVVSWLADAADMCREQILTARRHRHMTNARYALAVPILPDKQQFCLTN